MKRLGPTYLEDPNRFIILLSLAARCPQAILLELYLGTSLFDSLLEILSFCLWHSLLYGCRSTVNEILCVLQTETASLLDSLYYSELVSTYLSEDYVERVLLGSCLWSCACARSSSNSNSCSSWLNTILVLQDLCEFIYFFYCEVHEFLSNSFNICHFYLKI